MLKVWILLLVKDGVLASLLQRLQKLNQVAPEIGLSSVVTLARQAYSAHSVQNDKRWNTSETEGSMCFSSSIIGGW